MDVTISMGTYYVPIKSMFLFDVSRTFVRMLMSKDV